MQKSDSDLSSGASTPPPSTLLHTSSDPSLSERDDNHSKTEGVRRGPLSLKERSKIPFSFYISVSSAVLLQFCSGMWTMDTLLSLLRSYSESIKTTGDLVRSACDTLAHPTDAKEVAQTVFVLLGILSIAYVFLIAPAMAGLWSYPKARKHKTHRFMGLFFLAQYSLAWVEFFTNYKGSSGLGGTSYIPHAVALNGTPMRRSIGFVDAASMRQPPSLTLLTHRTR